MIDLHAETFFLDALEVISGGNFIFLAYSSPTNIGWTVTLRPWPTVFPVLDVSYYEANDQMVVMFERPVVIHVRPSLTNQEILII